ncbi:MAG: AraC family transcriptional regulator ligand-binding domain-containing protein [Gammaproteobacteria bacterium]|jgi:AraC-like DNA-binding protein
MKSIPLIRASYVYPTTSLLAERGAPVCPMIKEAGLPSIVLELSDEFVPQLGARRLMELAYTRWGMTDVGLEAARRLDRATLSPLVSAMAGAPTMHAALEALCPAIAADNTHARYWVVRDADVSWICRHASLFDVAKAQAEICAAVVLVRLLRELLGSRWRPARMRLAAAADPDLESVEEFRGCQVELGAPFTALAVPSTLVPRTTVRAEDREPRERESAPTSPLNALQTLLRPYLREAYLRIDLAADAMGTSARTLQRRLSQQGLNYSEVVDRARFDLAVERLMDPDAKITDIAYDLGFKDPGSFSRTFKRLSGLSPREFRRARHVEIADDAASEHGTRVTPFGEAHAWRNMDLRTGPAR